MRSSAQCWAYERLPDQPDVLRGSADFDAARQALAEDPDAAKKLARWGGAGLAPKKIENLLA